MDEIIAAIHADIGRSANEVLATEILPTAAALKFLEHEAKRVLRSRRIPRRLTPTWLWGCRDSIRRRPWGVVGVIGTWNYPLFLNVGPIAQALVAGNGVLWKPSENAPATAKLIAELFQEAGFLDNLLISLPATREAGPALAVAEIDYLIFTGSEAVGRKLAAKLGEHLIPSTLELSGCDALFVLSDADLELAVNAAWFGVSVNSGQTCIAVRRIFVDRSLYARFETRVRTLMLTASPLPLLMPAQREQARWVIDEARDRGARVCSTESIETNSSNHSLAPTFLFDAHPDMAICQEQIFAPVCAVIPFDDLEEAIAMARRCRFELAASIFSANTRNAEQLAVRITAGSVSFNDTIAPTAHPATPFGGRGASGWGVTQGTEGLLAMTVPQVVTVRRGRFRPHFDEMIAPDPATLTLLRGLLRVTHARRWFDRVRGLGQLIKGIWRKGKQP